MVNESSSASPHCTGSYKIRIIYNLHFQLSDKHMHQLMYEVLLPKVMGRHGNLSLKTNSFMKLNNLKVIINLKEICYIFGTQYIHSQVLSFIKNEIPFEPLKVIPSDFNTDKLIPNLNFVLWFY